MLFSPGVPAGTQQPSHYTHPWHFAILSSHGHHETLGMPLKDMQRLLLSPGIQEQHLEERVMEKFKAILSQANQEGWSPKPLWEGIYNINNTN